MEKDGNERLGSLLNELKLSRLTLRVNTRETSGNLVASRERWGEHGSLIPRNGGERGRATRRRR